MQGLAWQSRGLVRSRGGVLKRRMAGRGPRLPDKSRSRSSRQRGVGGCREISPQTMWRRSYVICRVRVITLTSRLRVVAGATSLLIVISNKMRHVLPESYINMSEFKSRVLTAADDCQQMNLNNFTHKTLFAKMTTITCPRFCWVVCLWRHQN